MVCWESPADKVGGARDAAGTAVEYGLDCAYLASVRFLVRQRIAIVTDDLTVVVIVRSRVRRWQLEICTSVMLGGGPKAAADASKMHVRMDTTSCVRAGTTVCKKFFPRLGWAARSNAGACHPERENRAPHLHLTNISPTVQQSHLARPSLVQWSRWKRRVQPGPHTHTHEQPSRLRRSPQIIAAFAAALGLWAIPRNVTLDI